MFKLSSSIIVAAAFLTINTTQAEAGWFSSKSKTEKIQNTQFISRFVIDSDESWDHVANTDLPKSWWSRPFEYAWAAQFAGKDLVVLDAACGVSHPFKWMLNEKCKETWACDTDPRIKDLSTIIAETRKDLGEAAYQNLVKEPRTFEAVRLVCASICKLPNYMPKFDRIFCISTLEHMTKQDRHEALMEFSRKLAPGGLIVLTVDYPVVTPQELLQSAEDAGLEPAFGVESQIPDTALTYGPDGFMTNQELKIFRCVLKQKS